MAFTVAVASPCAAHAAACCLSAASFGIGRLAIWERGAAGLTSLAASDRGRWDAAGTFRAFAGGYRQDEARAEIWALARLHERWQAQARAPWVVGIRGADGVATSVGHGIGDVQLGLRWDAVLLGEFLGLPGVALTATATAPTATRAEQATDPLGASATGRGAWVAALALAVERSVLPYFVRLDLGASQPFGFERIDLAKTQRYGRGYQLGLAAGREVGSDKLVIAGQAIFDCEGAYSLDGVERAETAMRGLNLGVSLAFRLSPRWTITAAGTTDAASGWVSARNRTERWSASVGVRHALQQE